MANVGAFKNLGENDIVSTRTLLHEAIPLTGTIVSGTYNDNNIKFHTHGMFQTVYDYPYLSSSANHIFDITYGMSTNSAVYDTSVNQYKKKKNVYNQMAQILVGYDVTGSVLEFDGDGNILAGGSKLRDNYIIPFSRLLVKDEIKKESFSMELGVASAVDFAGALFDDRITISDVGAKTSYFVNSPAGEYAVLYATASNQTGKLLHETGVTTIGSNVYHPVGLIYYQAGIVVITGSVFKDQDEGGIIHDDSGSCNFFDANLNTSSSFDDMTDEFTIKTIGNNLRNRIYNISFNNTTELNSTIYFCRANHNEFNYSTNPTYLSGSKIIVKEDNPSADPISYITTIGLYSPNNELMAVAKLSEPLKKTPSQEFTLRVRLDY
mgnify:CR=1 FL=1|tara:strand:- start:1597 stop:2733 length:1137 start_codon:yes stop_codon:yes gene_type:complete